MSDDGHAPGLAQDLLPLLLVHVPHVGVVFGEAEDPGDEEEALTQLRSAQNLGRPERDRPFQLGDPEDVLSAFVQDRQQRHVLSLLQRVWVGGDGPHFGHLVHKGHSGDDGNPGDSSGSTRGLTDPGLSADLQTLLQTQLVLLRGHDGSETGGTVTSITLAKNTRPNLKGRRSSLRRSCRKG